MSSIVPQGPAPPGELLTLDEVGDFVGAHVRTVRRWVRSGRIPVVRFGRRMVRVKAIDLATFIDKHVVSGVR